MSSIFQGLVQSSTGLVNFSVGTGAIPIIAAEMRGLRINAVADAEGAFPVYASVGQASASVGSGGLSFDAYGRLRITTTVPSTIVQLPGGIIADETGSLVVFGPAEIIYQGVALTYIGYVSALSQTPVPLFYWKGQNTLAATTGTDPTFTRATAATFEDFEGVIRTVESQEPRFQGARRVENLTGVFNSENTTGWTGYGSVGDTVTHDTVDFPAGTSSSTKYVSSSPWQGSQKGGLLLAGNTYTISYFAKGAVGGETVWANDGVNAHGTQVITSSWARYSKTFTQAVDHSMAFGNTFGGQTVNFSGMQIEDVTGQTNKNPSEYVSTGVASATAPELVVNGTFDGLTNWSVASGEVSASGNVCTFSNVNGIIYQSISGIALGDYVISFDYDVNTGNTIRTNYNGALISVVGSSGTYTGSFTKTSTATQTIYFYGYNDNGETCSISNVSLKQAEHGANVDGVQYFKTLNANTVTGNVVTEAVGSPITRANTQFGDLHGVAGDYFSTPNVVTTWPELDIRARATVDSINNFYAMLADKAYSFVLQLTPSGSSQRLRLFVYTSAGTVSSFSIPFPTSQLGVRNWYRGTYDAATGDVKFFTADGNLESPTISDYAQLGTTQNLAAGAIAVNTSSFLAGAFGPTPNTYPFDGRIYRSQVFNEIDGTTPVVDFDFGDYVSGSTWTGIPNGPELVTNGDFNNGTTGWAVRNSSNATIAAVSNQLVNTVVNSGANGVYQQITTVIGKSYTLSNLLVSKTAINMRIRIGTALGGTQYATLVPTSNLETTTLTFTATSTSLFYELGYDSNPPAGAQFVWDNISLKENQVFTLEGNASVFQPPVDASGPFGYLAEKASANLAIQSEDFGTWSEPYVTIVSNVAVAPDGTTTMDRVAISTANIWHAVYRLISTTANTNYTYSVYMKDDGAGFGGMVFGTAQDYITVVVDLSSGLVTHTGVGSNSGTIIASGCEDAGNGIYRVWISGNIGTTSGFIVPFISDVAVPTLLNNGMPYFSGVAGEDILVWGAQAEIGTYPTSYIPTTTTAVTRNADVLIAGDMVTDAAGTGYAEASSIWSTSPVNNFVLARTGAGRLIYAGSAQVSTGVRVYDGTTEVFSPIGSSYQYLPASVASTWGAELIAYKDGVGGTASSYNGTMSSGNLGIGASNTGASQWDGTIREVKIFDSELTAEEVGDL